MEILTFLLLVGFFPVNPLLNMAPMWPPRHTQDLVLLTGGADPVCQGTTIPYIPSKDLARWRELISSVPQLLLDVDYKAWLLSVLKVLVPLGDTPGDLKQLLLWGISHNLSWGFSNLPLLKQPSVESQVFGVSLNPDRSVFLQRCADHLLPAFREACRALYKLRNSILQSLCLLTAPHQSTEMDWQFCGFLSSLLTDLLTDPCKTWTGRTGRVGIARSLVASCAYSTWYGSTDVSPTDVSTCSESDRQEFIQSVCGNQQLLTQLSTQPENNWLNGFCAYNTNPQNMCHYTSWVYSHVSAFSVAYCWLYDQDQFIEFLCSNVTFLEQLTQNPDNIWLDPICSTESPLTETTFTLIEELCSYRQWLHNTIDSSSVAFCAENDRDGFVGYVCQSPDILLQLMESEPWITRICFNTSSNAESVVKDCVYSIWLETNNRGQLELSSEVVLSRILFCSQVDESQFAASVCTNISMLLSVAMRANYSWIQDFCFSHLSIPQNMCNYTSWGLSTPERLAVGLCWLFYQEQVETYLCSNPAVLQMVEDSIPSEVNCTQNSSETSICSSFGSIPSPSPYILGYCAAQEPGRFQQHICKNSTFVAQLSTNPENSWIPMVCAGQIDINISQNCSYWTSSYITSSCPNCSMSEQKKMASMCNDLHLVQTLGLFSNQTIFQNQIIVWQFCTYSSWVFIRPSPFLMHFCWMLDPVNFIDFLCQNQAFHPTISSDPDVSKLLLNCPSYKKCNYAEWSSGVERGSGSVNISTLIECSKVDAPNFLVSVCNNPWILMGISDVPAITWTLSFCYNISGANILAQVLQWSVCNYSRVTDLAPFLIEFCWLYDQENISSNICADSTFPLLIKAHQKNFWLEPLCFPSTRHVIQNHSITHCQYRGWEPLHVDVSLLSFCAEYDFKNFNNIFCNDTSGFTQENNTTSTLSCVGRQKLCSYQNWQASYTHPVIAKLCWAYDPFNFTSEVCANSKLMATLLQDTNNSWLRPVCGVQNKYRLGEVVSSVCRYKDWQDLETVPPSIIAFCKTYNQDDFSNSIYSFGSWWNQKVVCDYEGWKTGTPTSDNIAMCWVLDRANFTTQLCEQLDLISKLSNDSRTSWINLVCSIHSSSNETESCLSDDNKKQLGWECDVSLTSVCLDEGLTMLSFLHLSLCSLQNAGLSLDVSSIKTVYEENVDLLTVLFLLLEEMQVLVISGSDMVRTEALSLVLRLLTEDYFQIDQKIELLQTFGNTLVHIGGEQATPDLGILIKEFFNLPLSNFTSSIFHLSPTATKIFLNIVSKNWTSLGVPDEYMSAVVLTLMNGQVKTNAELFTHLVPFLHYLEPDELIRLLPPLQDNKDVLQAVGIISSSLSADHRLALSLWIRRSLVFQNISSLSDSFVQKVGNLLPLLPLNTFQQLNTHQVMCILHCLPMDISPPYQRIVASRVLLGPNITAQQVELLGPFVCQANVQDLARHRQDGDVFSVLKRNLLHCVKRGDLYPETKLIDVLFDDQPWQDPRTLSWQSLADMSPLLPSLGVTFLQNIHPEQLSHIMSEVGSVALTRAQARELIHKIQTNGSVPDAELSTMGSLVLGLSPVSLQQLSTNQLSDLIPALSSQAKSLSGAQALAAIRSVWASGNITNRLQDLGPLLYLLPLILLRARSREILSNREIAAGVKWNLQQAQFLIREAKQIHGLQGGSTPLGNLLTGVDCESLLRYLRDDFIETLAHLHNITTRLPDRLTHAYTFAPQLFAMQDISSTEHIFRNLRYLPPVRSSAGLAKAPKGALTRPHVSMLTKPFHSFQRNVRPSAFIVFFAALEYVRCVLDKLSVLPFTPQLMKSLSPQIKAAIMPRAVSVLSPRSCRYLIKSLRSEIQFVIELPNQRRLSLMNALIRCLGQAGIYSPAEQFVTLGSLTPFLNGSSYLSVYRKILMQNVESVTNYCYPQETQQVLTQLLQEPSMLGKPIQWQPLALQRLDRLVSLFPERSLQSLNTAVLSSRWVLQIFSEENKWAKSPLGAACVQSEIPAQRAAHTLRRRTLLRRSLIAQSSLRASLPTPDCRTLRGATASVWGTGILVKMSSIDFMDCLEEIGQDPDITSKELTSLLNRVLQISGPVSEIPPLMIARFGRLSTKLSQSQLQQVLLADMQVMEALGREKEWTTKQLQALAQGFLRSNSLSVQDLDGVHLATLGHALCGLRSEDMEQLQAHEFCSAVLYLGSLPLQCTEQQLLILTRLCAHSDVFGPVSQWTEDIFREMGSVAAGLQDIELSSLVLEQIQGLSPLAMSLMPPKKFAVSFSALQLRMFSWSQAMGVTNQQWRLLDQEQQKSLNVILTGEENGTQDYRGMSHAGHCSLCPLLFYCSLLQVLCVISLS